jgi:hypothetical protein
VVNGIVPSIFDPLFSFRDPEGICRLIRREPPPRAGGEEVGAGAFLVN